MNQGESHKSRLISLNYNLLNIRFGLNQEAQFNVEGWNWIKKNINFKKISWSYLDSLISLD